MDRYIIILLSIIISLHITYAGTLTYVEDSNGTYPWLSSGCVGTNAFDTNWATYAQETSGACNLYVNYTIPASLNSAITEHKIETEEDKADEGIAYVYCKNDGGTWTQLRYLDIGEAAINRNDTIDPSCLTTSTLELRFQIEESYSDGYARLYEEKVWWNVTTGDDTYPTFQNITSNTNTIQYSGNLVFNATIIDGNGTGGIVFGGTTYFANNVSNFYSVNFSYEGDGIYSYYWFGYGNGESNNYNSSQSYSYTILETDHGDYKFKWINSISSYVFSSIKESGLFEFFSLLRLWNTDIPNSCNEETSGAMYFDIDTNSSYLCDGNTWEEIITVNEVQSCVPSVTYGTPVYTAHAYSDTGNEYASTLTSLSTNGAIFTCDDCITFGGAASTCSDDTNNWLSCTMVVSCS